MDFELDEDSWKDLLAQIDEGKVIPVVGAGVVTRDDRTPFYPWLAHRLAESLNVPVATLPASVDLNAVATAYLLDPNREPGKLYTRLNRILQEECPAPGQVLLDLASVLKFNLYLTTTFDPLLQKAINQVRYGGAEQTNMYAFSPKALVKDLPSRRCNLEGTNVFHLLGRFSAQPDYVVWEDDMLEFMFALNKSMKGMQKLGLDLKEHGLLFLGLNFSDWMLRFFLRIIKREPLSAVKCAFIADGPGDYSPQSLVLYFSAVSRDIKIMRQEPVAFCSELARRWRERNPAAAPRPSLPPVSAKMPRGAIFVSYAREDESAAANLVRGLQAAGCIVWYDRQRLRSGHHYPNLLHDEVTERCGLFLSLISRTTEQARESYFILERNWAAERAPRLAPGEEFYIPVIVDDLPSAPQREPKVFESKITYERLPGGEVTDVWVQHILEVQRNIMARPR
jgi:hypothetical protein